MIVRIVTMKFKKDLNTQFKEIYNNTRPLILQSKGCISVCLLEDIHDPQRLTTFSEWETERDLNLYRESELFKSTWNNVKQLFDAKPQANSYIKYI